MTWLLKTLENEQKQSVYGKEATLERRDDTGDFFKMTFSLEETTLICARWSSQNSERKSQSYWFKGLGDKSLGPPKLLESELGDLIKDRDKKESPKFCL